MENNQLLDFKVLGDKRGSLIALEPNKEIPFEIKRVFYIYNTIEGISRGNHSHYKTKQFLVAVHGSCEVTLDDGKKKETFVLDKPTIGLFQDSMIWGVMHNFSSDCVLMVLADNIYNANDYINDYSLFLELKNDN